MQTPSSVVEIRPRHTTATTPKTVRIGGFECDVIRIPGHVAISYLVLPDALLQVTDHCGTTSADGSESLEWKVILHLILGWAETNHIAFVELFSRRDGAVHSLGIVIDTRGETFNRFDGSGGFTTHAIP